MRSLLQLLFLFSVTVANAQTTIYPAPVQQNAIAIINATLHVGNGSVIERGTVVFDKGKITYVGAATSAPAATETINAEGMHVYPGLILPSTDLGLKEVANGLRGANDFREIEEINASVRSLVAYNTDSRVINTLRSNGILLAHVVPQGGLIGGASSVVQLDAWNWEDATYKTDNGIHVYMPVLLNRPQRGRRAATQQNEDAMAEGLERVEKIRQFLRDARAYNQKEKNEANLKLQAVQGLFTKKQKLFVHTNSVREMLLAVEIANEFNLDMTIVGGNDSWMIAPLLKQHNVSVILNQPHNLPVLQDDDIDQPYKTPAMLQKEGVLFAINDNHNESRYRNLPFNAGTAATYGLTKEEALAAITLNAARILGIDDRTGSLQVGKDANIIISKGDILDMHSSIVTAAFIEGRKVNLDDSHKQLRERYEHKYGIGKSGAR